MLCLCIICVIYIYHLPIIHLPSIYLLSKTVLPSLCEQVSYLYLLLPLSVLLFPSSLSDKRSSAWFPDSFPFQWWYKQTQDCWWQTLQILKELGLRVLSGHVSLAFFPTYPNPRSIDHNYFWGAEGRSSGFCNPSLLDMDVGRSIYTLNLCFSKC